MGPRAMGPRTSESPRFPPDRGLSRLWVDLEGFLRKAHDRVVSRLGDCALGSEQRESVLREPLRRHDLALVERLVLAGGACLESGERDLGLAQQQPADDEM